MRKLRFKEIKQPAAGYTIGKRKRRRALDPALSDQKPASEPLSQDSDSMKVLCVKAAEVEAPQLSGSRS